MGKTITVPGSAQPTGNGYQLSPYAIISPKFGASGEQIAYDFFNDQEIGRWYLMAFRSKGGGLFSALGGDTQPKDNPDKAVPVPADTPIEQMGAWLVNTALPALKAAVDAAVGTNTTTESTTPGPDTTTPPNLVAVAQEALQEFAWGAGDIRPYLIAPKTFS